MGIEPPIVEREQGLRYGITRALCVIASLSWFALIAAVSVLLYAVFIRSNGDIADQVNRLFTPIVWFGAVMWGSQGLLWLWRRCDRCRRRLFEEGRPNWARWAPGLSAFDRNWLKRNASWMNGAPERDHRAKTLLGSHRMRAIADMAFGGRLRCQWCGHEDGATPDYVVTGSE
ncbi:hypothetical protein DSM104635_01421 [Terricaulis silvestris]|uniref:Uncharacterized protein n=1 Tax=Terricaulis silvestris TaxID=2686094 RepID=A0A6I6MKR9_9CAUL|nr:hypothetical protein DSM104635_01421 [Terricaulis silvestris]